MLQTLRTAAGPPTGEPAMSVALPVPGDVRGLAAGTQFQLDAITAGEAIIVSRGGVDGVGLVPDFNYDDITYDDSAPEFDEAVEYGEPTSLSWTAYSLPVVPVPAYPDLGQAEYDLRSAVRSAADALGTLRAGASDPDVADPRGLVEQILESGRLHRAPDHTPARALRVLENAAHVDAIITVSSGLMPIGLQTSSEMQIANDALQPLTGIVRTARMAAVTEILHSAWRA
jgi:hypothetical protein